MGGYITWCENAEKIENRRRFRILEVLKYIPQDAQKIKKDVQTKQDLLPLLDQRKERGEGKRAARREQNRRLRPAQILQLCDCGKGIVRSGIFLLDAGIDGGFGLQLELKSQLFNFALQRLVLVHQLLLCAGQLRHFAL